MTSAENLLPSSETMSDLASERPALGVVNKAKSPAASAIGKVSLVRMKDDVFGEVFGLSDMPYSGNAPEQGIPSKNTPSGGSISSSGSPLLTDFYAESVGESGEPSPASGSQPASYPSASGALSSATRVLDQSPLPVATPSERTSADRKEGSLLSPETSEAAMREYNQLQLGLLGLTAVLGAVIFPFVWGFYSLSTALSYLLGASVSLVYLRMLGRSVSEIGRKDASGRQKKDSSGGRLALVAGIVVVALRWNQLDVIPVFLGFLTYKAAIIAFVLWTSVMPQAQRSEVKLSKLSEIQAEGQSPGAADAH